MKTKNLLKSLKRRLSWMLCLVAFLMVGLVTQEANASTKHNVRFVAESSSWAGTSGVRTNYKKGGSGWGSNDMGNNGRTYNGRPVYEGEYWEDYGGLDELQFQAMNGSTVKSTVTAFNSWKQNSEFEDKMYDASSSSWKTFSYDKDMLWINLGSGFSGKSFSSNKVTVTLEAGKSYEFGIKNSSGYYRGNTGTMTRDNCSGWTFEDGKGNAWITTDIAGDYVFTVSNLSGNPVLTVTYPTIKYYITGPASGSWGTWKEMTKESNTSYYYDVSNADEFKFSNRTDYNDPWYSEFKPASSGSVGATCGGGSGGNATVTLSTGYQTPIRIYMDPTAKTYYAVATIKQYSVTAAVGDIKGGSVTLDGSSSTLTKSVDYNTQVTFAATPSTGYNFKEWNTKSDGTGTKKSTSATYKVTITAATTLYAIFEVACTPPIIKSTTPGSRCGTGTVTIGATASAGTVKWYAVSTGGTSLGLGNSYTTPSIAATKTYYAEADDNGCVSTSRTEVTATVNTLPTATINGASSVCQNASTTLTAGGTGTSYSWNGGAYSDTNTYSVTTTSAGQQTIKLKVKDANGCESTEATKNVTVNALPTASISGSDEVCQNGSLTLTGSGGTQYSWNNADYSSKSTYNVPSSTSGSQNITLKVKDANSCVSASAAQKSVSVKAQPTAGTISGDPVCKGSTATLNVDNPSSASVQWQNSSKVDITGATGTSYKTPVLQESTDYYVKFTKDGCSSTSAKGTATVKTASLSLTATPAVVNPYTPVTLTAKNQSGTPTNSNWTITGAGSYFTESENPTGVSSVVMKPAKGVETTVTATATVDGCPVSGTYSVTPTADTETCN